MTKLRYEPQAKIDQSDEFLYLLIGCFFFLGDFFAIKKVGELTCLSSINSPTLNYFIAFNTES